jgi:hypothetical protein
MTQSVEAFAASLKPLRQDLNPQVAEWARELQALFAATDYQSIRRFVLLNPQIDNGTVSRYLRGERVPREHWLLDTLAAALDEAGRPLTPAAQEHLTMMHLRALEAAHPHEYKIRIISDELESAVAILREAKRYGRELELQLAQRMRQIRSLRAAQRRLRAAWDEGRSAMRAEHQRLREEIDDLSEQFHGARRRAAAAELRCQQLEGLLDRLEAERPHLAQVILSAHDGRPLEISDVLVPSLATASRTENRTGWKLLAPDSNWSYGDVNWPISHHGHRVGYLIWHDGQTPYWELAMHTICLKKQQSFSPVWYLGAPSAKQSGMQHGWADPAEALTALAKWQHYCPRAAVTVLFSMVDEGISASKASQAVHVSPSTGENIVRKAKRVRDATRRPLLDQLDDFL